MRRDEHAPDVRPEESDVLRAARAGWPAPSARGDASARGLAVAVAVALGGVGVVTPGCGLVSADVASISFDLPERDYVFDTSSWMLPSGTLPAIPCTSTDVCCDLAMVVGYDCASSSLPLICDTSQAPSTCGFSIPIQTPPQTINLQMQVPALSGFGNQSLANVSISKIQYDVTSTLNRALPPVNLFQAPAGVTSTTDPQAQAFGTVPATPANAQLTNEMVALAPNAGPTFAGYAYHISTPFEFLASATVVVRGGDSTPTGMVDIKVRGTVTAKPNL
jgi:hypothetical protein